MFEEIVNSKYEQLKNISDKIKNISVEEIKKSDLPLFTVNFLCTEQSVIEDRDTLNNLLEKSVKLSVNYTLRPKWTLINYLFGSYDSKPADEILKKAEVFGYYRYYTDLISNHIKDNALMFITQEEVEDLTEEANKVVLEKLVKETSGIKIKNFFSQIYKLKYGEDREINLDWSIPYLFIKLFLEDKGFQALIDKFKIIPGLDDSMEIEMKTAIKILTDKYYVNSDFFILKDEPANVKSDKLNVESETEILKKEEKIIDNTIKQEEKIDEKKIPTAEKNKTEEEEKPKGIIRIIKNIPTKRIHKEKKILDNKITEEKPRRIVEEEPIRDAVKETKEDISGEKKEVFEKTIDSDNIIKIKHLFKKDELDIIKKKVFKGSRGDMYDALEELGGFKTWQSASDYLKEIFAKNKVSLYNKHIVLFIDILSEHFSEIGKGK
jgi:hypothetical protein